MRSIVLSPIVVAAALVVGLAPVLAAQQPKNADAVAAADSLFKASDWAGAASAYAAIARTEPANGMAWFRAGVANQNLKKYSDALTSFRHALQLQFQVPSAWLRIARVQASTGEIDSALGSLDSLAASGFAQSPAVVQQPEFATLKDDARFRKVIARMDEMRYPCRTQPESRQLDYWAGSWDVFVNGNKAGTNDVVPMLGGCVLQENWTGGGGGEGKSVNYYDPNTRKWRQIWTDDGGGVLDYTGEFKDGAMRFNAVTIDKKGKRLLQKLTFFPIAPDSVRQLFETSADEGKTWVPGFDGMYIRRKK